MRAFLQWRDPDSTGPAANQPRGKGAIPARHPATACRVCSSHAAELLPSEPGLCDERLDSGPPRVPEKFPAEKATVESLERLPVEERRDVLRRPEPVGGDHG